MPRLRRSRVRSLGYLDRGDIKLLPVAGLIWTPNPEVRYELVFPRPRAVFQLTDRHRLYLTGELGGGTWAIERVALGNDLSFRRFHLPGQAWTLRFTAEDLGKVR